MLVLALALFPMASAQQNTPPADVNAQLFQPAIDGSYFRMSDSTMTANKTLVWRSTLDYSHRPLEYETWDGESVLVVGGLSQLDIGVGYRIGRFRIGADLPLLVHGGGDLGNTTFGIGQPYLDGKMLLIDDPESDWGAALGARVVVPNGAGPSEGLSGGTGAAFEAIGQRAITDAWDLTLTAGVWLQPTVDLGQTTWGNRLNVGLGQQFEIAGDTLLLTEITAQPVLAALDDPSARPAEVLIGAEIPMGAEPMYALRPAFSMGIGDAAGVPVYRLLMQLRRLPTEGDRDSDGDGLFDSVDACPEKPEDIDSYEDTDGCPEPTIVTVRIVDSDGMTPEGASWMQGESSGKDGDTVTLEAGDYDFAVGDVTESANIAAGPPTEVTLTVPAPRGNLTVNVVDEDGSPVEGALWSASGPLDIEDKPGNEIVPVRPGTYALKASAPGFRPAAGEVEVTLDGEATLTLTVLPSKVKMTKTRIDIKDSVYFETAKAVIQDRSFELLNEVAQILIDHPELLLVRIEGHTDDRGNNAYNKDLSQRRAESVRAYLVEGGVEEDRLTAVGYGEEKPLMEGRTAEAREKNRRVDFFVEKRADE